MHVGPNDFFFLFLGFYADPSTRESVLALVGFINLVRCSCKFIGFNFCGLEFVTCGYERILEWLVLFCQVCCNKLGKVILLYDVARLIRAVSSYYISTVT